MSEFKGKITIAGKTYDCEVRNGVRYIDGVTSDEFIKRLPFDEVLNLCMTGIVAVEAEKGGIDVSAKRVYESFDQNPN